MNTTSLRFLLALLLSLMVGTLSAQKPGFVTGSIKDMFSEEGLSGVKVSLFRPDSTLVDSTHSELQKKDVRVNQWALWEEDDKKQGAIFRLHVPDEGHYRLVLAHEGYETVEREVLVDFRRIGPREGVFVVVDTEAGERVRVVVDDDGTAVAVRAFAPQERMNDAGYREEHTSGEELWSVPLEARPGAVVAIDSALGEQGSSFWVMDLDDSGALHLAHWKPGPA